MNREIKFRGWDIYNERWIYGELITCQSPFSQIVQNANDITENGVGTDIHPKSLGQFTGLHDSKGVEIYEGDIIELDHWRPKRWEVTYDRGAFCMRDTPDASYYPDCKYTEKAIVIGNIYESPELLEAK